MQKVFVWTVAFDVYEDEQHADKGEPLEQGLWLNPEHFPPYLQRLIEKVLQRQYKKDACDH